MPLQRTVTQPAGQSSNRDNQDNTQHHRPPSGPVHNGNDGPVSLARVTPQDLGLSDGFGDAFAGIAGSSQRRQHAGIRGSLGSVMIADMSAPSQLAWTDVARRRRTVVADANGDTRLRRVSYGRAESTTGRPCSVPSKWR
jgi:hypothetical protein